MALLRPGVVEFMIGGDWAFKAHLRDAGGSTHRPLDEYWAIAGARKLSLAV
jgi:hypothetical protein